jgi:hypothetical protein
MNGTMHRLIVQSAARMLPPEMVDYLSTGVIEGQMSPTRLDLILKGAVGEDSTTEPSPLPNPNLQAIPSVFFGDYWPDMEHFWNPDLEAGKGLTITCEGLGALVGMGLGQLGGYLAGGLAGGEVVLAQFRSALDRATEYWNAWVLDKYNAGNLEEALMNLGRVVHLLADVGTPCHVHGDPHMNIMGYDDDDYEKYCGDRARELGDRLPWEWECQANTGVVYHPNWDLGKYFYELGEISRLYDSDDCNGRGNGHPYRWDHWYESLVNILPIDRDITGDLTDEACYAIACDLIPIEIRFTAGLLCYFFKCIGFNVALDVVEVNIRRIHVYDDTDPMGSGEIFLSANLNNHPLVQVGGQWDIASGKSSAIGGADFSLAVRDRTQPVYFYAHAYDDDSSYFYPDDSESLGDIVYGIDLTTLDANPVTIRANSAGGSGSFGLDLEIQFYPRAQEIASFASIMNQFDRRILKDVSILKTTRYQPYQHPPLLVNLETMALHGLSGLRHCKKWEKMDAGKKLELHMYEYELFEDLDGKTRLARIVEKIHGEDSKQARSVAGVKEFKGYCSCLRKGWGTKVK